MTAVFQSPARYVQGRNATALLATELTNLGLVDSGPVFVLASASPRKLLSEVWKRAFAEAGIEYLVEPFAGECSPEEIARVRGVADDAHATVIVGAGGGKVLDTSRAVAADLALPAVNCPTVASSDAPCSALSVMYRADGEFLEYRFYRKNPDLVLVDTSIIALAPPRLLATGIGDALATWWEARAVAEAGAPNQLLGDPTTSGTALAGLCYDLLLANGAEAVRACSTRAVTPALERIVEANTLLSGLGFESGGLAAAHSIHNGLTAVPETHPYMHGEKVSFGLVVQLVLEGRPRNDLDEVLTFARSVGLPTTLADVGLDDTASDTIRTIADRSVADGETIHHEPVPVDADIVADAIIAADASARAFARES